MLLGGRIADLFGARRLTLIGPDPVHGVVAAVRSVEGCRHAADRAIAAGRRRGADVARGAGHRDDAFPRPEPRQGAGRVVVARRGRIGPWRHPRRRAHLRGGLAVGIRDQRADRHRAAHRDTAGHTRLGAARRGGARPGHPGRGPGHRGNGRGHLRADQCRQPRLASRFHLAPAAVRGRDMGGLRCGRAPDPTAAAVGRPAQAASGTGRELPDAGRYWAAGRRLLHWIVCAAARRRLQRPGRGPGLLAHRRCHGGWGADRQPGADPSQRPDRRGHRPRPCNRRICRRRPLDPARGDRDRAEHRGARHRGDVRHRVHRLARRRGPRRRPACGRRWSTRSTNSAGPSVWPSCRARPELGSSLPIWPVTTSRAPSASGRCARWSRWRSQRRWFRPSCAGSDPGRRQRLGAQSRSASPAATRPGIRRSCGR